MADGHVEARYTALVPSPAQTTPTTILMVPIVSGTLSTSYNERIFLSFTTLQMENCCHCDYVAVYDGPSTSSQYLGKVCNGSVRSFQSSSKYLTVVFRSDGSVVGQGFRALFTSTLSPNLGRVDCSSSYMNIVIQGPT
ncbi:CUB and zona pellucida-like domain-containing protein 1 [Thalassophryne amazonica]|uniref:CUB and zona pellucida-like domain-containing protein 1 n=1 Tax=Thalassophryne amazonica TaxID=390379 RepID=UPI001471F5AF|nr:CUB and zona pellucida-like domain-containing protein 1 [Thalassophryne amazonica]